MQCACVRQREPTTDGRRQLGTASLLVHSPVGFGPGLADLHIVAVHLIRPAVLLHVDGAVAFPELELSLQNANVGPWNKTIFTARIPYNLRNATECRRNV